MDDTRSKRTSLAARPVSRRAFLGGAAATLAATARPEHAHAVHVDVQGLEPGRPYWYRFVAGDDETPIARTRTAPADHVLPHRLRFAGAGTGAAGAGSPEVLEANPATAG